MSRAMKQILAVSLALTLTLPAFGQRMRMMGMAGHPMMHSGGTPMVFHGTPVSPFSTPMFQMPSVARQLHLTPHQSSQLNAATMQLQSQFRSQAQNLAMADRQQRQFQAMHLLGNFDSGFMRAAATILDTRQLGRLEQLQTQTQGTGTFMSPTIRSQLGLTENQINQLRMGSNHNRQMMTEMTRMSQRNPQAAMNTLQSMLANTESLLGSTLSPQQLAALQNMTGMTTPGMTTTGMPMTMSGMPMNMIGMPTGGQPLWMGLAGSPYSMAGSAMGGGYGGGSGGGGYGGGGGYSQGSDQGYGQGQTAADYGQDTYGEVTPSVKLNLKDRLTGRIENRTQKGSFPEPLFRLDHVARKLSLSSEQFYRLNTLTDQLQERYAPQLDEKERQARTRDVLRAYSADWMKGAEDILNARQMADYRDFVTASGMP